MDVDASVEGIPVVGILPIQPENPGHNGVTARSIGGTHFASGFSGLEYGSGGHPSPNFPADTEMAERCGVAPLVVPRPES